MAFSFLGIFRSPPTQQNSKEGIDTDAVKRYKQFAKKVENQSLLLLVAGVALAILGLMTAPAGFSLLFLSVPCIYFGRNGSIVADNINKMTKNKQFIQENFKNGQVNRQKIRSEMNKSTFQFKYFIHKAVDALSPRPLKGVKA